MDQYRHMSERQRRKLSPEEREQFELAERAEREEQELDSPMTKRQIAAAIDATVVELGGSGTVMGDAICDAFRKLLENITS